MLCVNVWFLILCLLYSIPFSWERDRWSVLGPHQKACWQLHWSPRVLGLQCCWWRHWFWTWFPSVGASVSRLWQEIKAWVHSLPFSSGVYLCCWAIQQCPLYPLPLGAHWCGYSVGQWGHLWHMQAVPWHWATHLHQPEPPCFSGMVHWLSTCIIAHIGFIQNRC